MTARVFAIRTLMAVGAVLSFAAYERTDLETFRWIGLVSYSICFLMYLKALFLFWSSSKRVTAALLVVTVFNTSWSIDLCSD
jgi:hypothetical protein